MASSSSIFSRPISPPPRAATPDILNLVALNPPVRSRKIPGRSNPESHQRPSPLKKQPSRGILKATPPPSPSPNSPASSSYSSSSSSSSSSRASNPTLNHRRSIQFAIPYRSPPASPTLAAAPPPVPPIPSFVLDGPDNSRVSQQISLTPPRPSRNPQRVAVV